jgi:anaerobic magnesium-protoporphyrin IX monomethyl ester cyclase
MKKILFVIFTENFSWGAAILASLAQRHGWLADILFLPRENTSERFISYAEDFRPDVVAISFMSYNRRQAFKVADISQQMGMKVIAGGVHPTFLPEDVVETGFFDAVVVGDGMGVLEDLLDRAHQLVAGSSLLIQGKRHADRMFYTRLFYSASQIKRMENTRSAMLLSSQGCPFKCRFCASGALDYLAYNPDEIVGMMDKLHIGYGVNNFQFFDDLFAHSAQRVSSIHNSVISHFGMNAGIKYGNFVQARTNTFNESIAEELVKMGVSCVNFGIETASPKLLDFLNKKQSQENCYKAMNICKDYGLVRKVNLMFGLPTQDKEDYEASLRFVKETNPEIKTCFFFVPMPGSDLYDYCFSHGYMPEHYNRNRFDWFDDQPDGFVDIQCRLKNVDYEMAMDYKNRIEKSDDQVEFLSQQVSLVDRQPWVILGTSKTYYFKRFIERLSSIKPSNCLGYIDLEEDGGFAVDSALPIQKYDKGNPLKPSVCTTYCYLNGDDFKFIRKATDEHFGQIPLISFASYKNHSLDDIEQLTRGTKNNECHPVCHSERSEESLS